MTERNKGRKISLIQHSVIKAGTVFARSLLLLCLLPAFSFSCTADMPYSGTTIILKTRFQSCPTRASDSWDLVRTLDVFVFNDDGLKRLDQRQHLTNVSSDRVSVFSSEGDKIVAVIANLPPECSSGLDSVYDYESLEMLFSDYRYDSPHRPVMSGETVFRAGSSKTCELILRPVMSMVDISRVECRGDALGLKKLSVYLIDLSCRCEVMRQNGFRPSELICCGAFNEIEVRSMTEPSMACRNLSLSSSGAGKNVWKGTGLYCYPDDASEETSGSPFTRLVVEGELDGVKRYYPLAVGRGGEQKDGVLRDVRYSYDICLQSRGKDHPYDEPDPADVAVTGSVAIYPSSLIYASVGEEVHIWCETIPENIPLALDMDALEDDSASGLHTFVVDPDGRGVTLYLRERGTSIVYFEAGDPVSDSALAFVVAR